jgi:hypothetical protein
MEEDSAGDLSANPQINWTPTSEEQLSNEFTKSQTEPVLSLPETNLHLDDVTFNEVPLADIKRIEQSITMKKTNIVKEEKTFNEEISITATLLQEVSIQETNTQMPLGNIENDDDEFGEFDDPNITLQAQIENIDNVQTTAHYKVVEEENVRINTFLASQNISETILTDFKSLLQTSFPIYAPLPVAGLASQGLIVEEEEPVTFHHPSARTSNKMLKPNQCMKESSWFQLYDKLSSDTVFSEKGTRFGWRRSYIRKMFLKSLNVELKEVSFYNYFFVLQPIIVVAYKDT